MQHGSMSVSMNNQRKVINAFTTAGRKIFIVNFITNEMNTTHVIKYYYHFILTSSLKNENSSTTLSINVMCALYMTNCVKHNKSCITHKKCMTNCASQ